MKEKLLGLIKNKKAMVVLLGVVGMLFIGISYFPTGKDEATPIEETDYLTETEQKLTEMIESIEGAGKTKVMLTLNADGEKVYKESSKIDSTKTEETVVIISGENGNEALIEKTLTPEVKGVVVVCEGGDSYAVKSDIISMISAVLGVSANRICVCKLSE